MYLDDILVTGSTEVAHLRALDEVLGRLEQAGLRVKRSKCVFMRPSVTYLGHMIDAEGLHPLDNRVRAIRDAPRPRSATGHFELVTDHKPLLGLLRGDRATPPHASSRIKRWSLFLSSYEYSLKLRNTIAHANADALSRLPLPEEPATTKEEPELVLLAEHLADSQVTASDIRRWTRHDKELSRVLQYVQQGWP